MKYLCLILGNIKVGDRVRLISFSPKTAAGFPAEGKVTKIKYARSREEDCIQNIYRGRL